MSEQPGWGFHQYPRIDCVRRTAAIKRLQYTRY